MGRCALLAFVAILAGCPASAGAETASLSVTSVVHEHRGVAQSMLVSLTSKLVSARVFDSVRLEPGGADIRVEVRLSPASAMGEAAKSLLGDVGDDVSLIAAVRILDGKNQRLLDSLIVSGREPGSKASGTITGAAIESVTDQIVSHLAGSRGAPAVARRAPASTSDTPASTAPRGPARSSASAGAGLTPDQKQAALDSLKRDYIAGSIDDKTYLARRRELLRRPGGAPARRAPAARTPRSTARAGSSKAGPTAAASTQRDLSKGPFGIAIGKHGNSSFLPTWSLPIGDITFRAEDIIADDPDLRLASSYYWSTDARRRSKSPGDISGKHVAEMDRFWSGTMDSLRLHRDRVFATGRSLGADAVLTFEYEKKDMQWPGEDYTAVGYLFDIPLDKVYETRGNDRQLREMIGRLFGQFKAGRAQTKKTP